MDLDVEQLQKDLQELQQKKEQAAERLRTLAPRGRGDRFSRGRGYGGAGGRFGSSPGRGPVGTGLRGTGRRPGSDNYDNGYTDHGWDAGRSARGGGFAARGAYGRGSPFNGRDGLSRDQAVPAAKKRTLSSAVVVDGEQRIPGKQQGEPPSLKRPAPSEMGEDPAMRKRNRRMFGNLLGTLQRFKEEEKAFKLTPTAQKQAEAMRRAEEKAAAAGQRLRQLERQKKIAERQGELDKIRQFNLQSDCKALEILYAKKIINRQRCLAYLLTKVAPSLYWVPKKHTPETSAALLEQQDEFTKWKAQQHELLQAEKDKLTEEAAARKAAALARAQKLQDNGEPGDQVTAEDDDVAKEEAELEQQLQQQDEVETGTATVENGAVSEPAAMQTDEAGEVKEDKQSQEPQPTPGSPDGEEDGELPDAGDDEQFRGEGAEATGGDLLDKLEMDAGNEDADNIEDLLE